MIYKYLINIDNNNNFFLDFFVLWNKNYLMVLKNLYIGWIDKVNLDN